MFVYELVLKDGRIYVGHTKDIVRRFKEHKDGIGSAWALRWPPIGISKIEETSGSDFKELSWTLQAMTEHGIDKVRGGPFTRTELQNDDIKTIIKLMKSNAFPSSVEIKEGDEKYFVSEPVETSHSAKGKAWSAIEDDNLLKELSGGKDVIDIAKMHGRSEGSILARRNKHILGFDSNASEIASKLSMSLQEVNSVLGKRQREEMK
jgi:hypothetical protein